MSDKHLKKISKKEAFVSIGLHPKDLKTYYIDNFIIFLEQSGLSITKVNGKDSDSPESTIHTSFGFQYSKNNTKYILKNENNDLIVYEQT